MRLQQLDPQLRLCHRHANHGQRLVLAPGLLLAIVLRTLVVTLVHLVVRTVELLIHIGIDVQHLHISLARPRLPPALIAGAQQLLQFVFLVGNAQATPWHLLCFHLSNKCRSPQDVAILRAHPFHALVVPAHFHKRLKGHADSTIRAEVLRDPLSCNSSTRLLQLRKGRLKDVNTKLLRYHVVVVDVHHVQHVGRKRFPGQCLGGHVGRVLGHGAIIVLKRSLRSAVTNVVLDHRDRHQLCQRIGYGLVFVEVGDNPSDVPPELPRRGHVQANRLHKLECPLEALHAKTNMVVVVGQRGLLIKLLEFLREVIAVPFHVLATTLPQTDQPFVSGRGVPRDGNLLLVRRLGLRLLLQLL